MDCCATESADGGPVHRPVTRRGLLRGMALTAGGLTLAACGFRTGGDREEEGLDPVQLAFCSQLLCVVPYEVTREAGFFADEGLDVELVYSRGGSAAMQALVGGSVDYAATSFDVAVQTRAEDAEIRRFVTTGRLPLFALATAPDTVDEITSVADLSGRQVAVSALGNADHTILLFLLNQAGVDPETVRFATIGTNIYDVLRLGQVDAAMVQEPALSLVVEDGGGELVNFMDIDDATEHLGGAYEFMGVAVREEEREERRDQMAALSRALERGLERVRTAPVEDLLDALPGELIAGEDPGQLTEILERYRSSLYPEDVDIELDAVERVINALSSADVLAREVTPDEILDTTVTAS